VLYDGLGRTIEARRYEGGSNYIATQTQYDSLGRAYKASNPFRLWQSETPVWTTSAFDALGRVTSVTTADSAVATTSYSGNTVTAADQAGKARKSVSDALGRLTTVYEDPSGSNYSTSYTYDVLDELITVSQGSQTRSFAYDSLKRMTSAANPESGTVNLTYDNNSNVLTKSDARSIVTTIAYDALNRPTSKTYSNDPLSTPAVYFYYDSQTLPSGAPSGFDRGYSTGALVGVTYGGSSASAGTYIGYDAAGRVVRQYQQTDSVNYLVEASYAPWGMTSETYPSVPARATAAQ
jgi:YD repeat-containing protein